MPLIPFLSHIFSATKQPIPVTEQKQRKLNQPKTNLVEKKYALTGIEVLESSSPRLLPSPSASPTSEHDTGSFHSSVFAGKIEERHRTGTTKAELAGKLRAVGERNEGCEWKDRVLWRAKRRGREELEERVRSVVSGRGDGLRSMALNWLRHIIFISAYCPCASLSSGRLWLYIN